MTGLGAGGVWSAVYPVGAELMPAQHRRTYGAIYEMALASSFTVLPFVGGLLAGSPNAFRFLALPGGLALPVVPAIIYLLLPESPRWHLRRGEAQIAVDIVNQIIRRSGNRVPPLTVAALGDVHIAAPEKLPPYWRLFAEGQLRWTAVGVITGTCAGSAAYMTAALLPKALTNQGYAVSVSLGMTSVIYLTSFFGKAFTGWLMEIIGRRWAIFLVMAGALPGFCLMLLAHTAGPYAHMLMIAGGLLVGFTVGLHGGVGVPRDPHVLVRAVPDGIARPRSHLRRIVRQDFRRRPDTVFHGAPYRLADDLLRHDDAVCRNRRFRPDRVGQGDDRPDRGDRRRARSATRLRSGSAASLCR